MSKKEMKFITSIICPALTVKREKTSSWVEFVAPSRRRFRRQRRRPINELDSGELDLEDLAGEKAMNSHIPRVTRATTAYLYPANFRL